MEDTTENISKQQILGVRFFDGPVAEAVSAMCAAGGLLVFPAAPALVNICYDPGYREALVSADLACADSGAMVLLWRLLRGRKIPRISGLVYLKCLLETPTVRTSGQTFFILPTIVARDKALVWLRGIGLAVREEDCYVAPLYGDGELRDEPLLDAINSAKPAHIVIGLGGGTQEKLGLYLQRNLAHRPAIHCIGAALGFLTGDQEPIPGWADRLYLGWFLRLARDPQRYGRRFWVAHELPGLMLRYGEKLPPLESRKGK